MGDPVDQGCFYSETGIAHGLFTNIVCGAQ